MQVVQRGDILPTLVRVAEEDHSTEARFKCVAALTLLAESLDNALPLLESGALHPLMDILHDAGADPTQWKGQTASWCVGFLMNIAAGDTYLGLLKALTKCFQQPEARVNDKRSAGPLDINFE